MFKSKEPRKRCPKCKTVMSLYLDETGANRFPDFWFCPCCEKALISHAEGYFEELKMDFPEDIVESFKIKHINYLNFESDRHTHLDW